MQWFSICTPFDLGNAGDIIISFDDSANEFSLKKEKSMLGSFSQYSIVSNCSKLSDPEIILPVTFPQDRDFLKLSSTIMNISSDLCRFCFICSS